jgi:hypothetical protein
MLDAGLENRAAEARWRTPAAVQSPPFLPQKPLEKDLGLHSRFFQPTPERERERERERESKYTLLPYHSQSLVFGAPRRHNFGPSAFNF